MAIDIDSAIIRNPLVVAPDTSVSSAIAHMANLQPKADDIAIEHTVENSNGGLCPYGLKERLTCVVVVDAGQVCGLLTERDVVCLCAQNVSLDKVMIRDVVVPHVVTLYEADFTELGVALQLLQRHNIRHLPLLDAQNRLTGLVTQTTLQSSSNFRKGGLANEASKLGTQQLTNQGIEKEQCYQDYNSYIKDVNAALRRSEAEKRAILSAIPDYLFCVDVNGIYRKVVTYQKEITLFSENLDPVGLSMAEVLPEEIATQQLTYAKEALQTGELKAYEHQVRLGDQIRDEEVRVIKSGEDEVLFIVRDISDRKRAERQLQRLIEGTAATTGQDFFPVLVRCIAEALDVAYALVTELIDGELHALAFWACGALHAPISYHPVKTPCDLVLQKGRFYCAKLLREHFPEDLDLVAMEAESYLGIALYDTEGNAIGDLCILDTQPIQAPQRAEQILRVFAARATAELERQRAMSALQLLNQSLEAKVVERTAELQEREQFLQTVLDTFPGINFLEGSKFCLSRL